MAKRSTFDERVRRCEQKMHNKRLKLVNDCAGIAYQIMGYKSEGIDFSKATHPQEMTCYAIAVRLFNHIEDSR